MSNTLGGWNQTVIAQEGFSAFKQALAPIMAFSTDFSHEALKKGTQVTTRVITAMSAGDWAGSYETGDTTTTAVDVSLNQHKFRSFHLTDLERTKSPADMGTWLKMSSEAAYAVGRSVVDYVLGLLVSGTYGDVEGTSKITKASASVDPDTVADIASAMTSRNIPQTNRSFIATNAVVTALLKTNSIQDASAFGSNAPIRDGEIGRLLGMRIFNYPDFPAALDAENTIAVGVHPSAIAVAVRAVPPPSDQTICHHEQLVDPDSGVTLGYRQWYNPDTGEQWGAFEALFGATAAQTTGAVRLVSS